MILEGLKSGEQVGSGGKQVFWLPLSSTKWRLDSLRSHHGAIQFFAVWLSGSDSQFLTGNEAIGALPNAPERF